MAIYELKLPHMGESVAEATITSWRKNVGETVELDDIIVEVATDKVDSEIPSEVQGVVKKILFEENSVVKIGETMALIEIEGEEKNLENTQNSEIVQQEIQKEITEAASQIQQTIQTITEPIAEFKGKRFYSPLVKTIAQRENISIEELETIQGTGMEGRVTKNDMLAYVKFRSEKPKQENVFENQNVIKQDPLISVSSESSDEIIEMTRMGKLISKYMVESKRTSPHVQSFTEVDMTPIWNWRNKVRKQFEQRYNEKLTFTPIFIEAVAKALRDFPMMNITTDGERIFKKKHINIGMATALPNGDLIVPVIKDADQLSLAGLAKSVNDLAIRARENKLKPDEIKGGTYTVTNIGSFGNIFGTPIINQPEVGILAIGAIRKVPAVIETPEGDLIGIRYKLILSHSYDHRVVNGALGGMFVQRVAQYLENWNVNRDI